MCSQTGEFGIITEAKELRSLGAFMFNRMSIMYLHDIDWCVSHIRRPSDSILIVTEICPTTASRCDPLFSWPIQLIALVSNTDWASRQNMMDTWHFLRLVYRSTRLKWALAGQSWYLPRLQIHSIFACRSTSMIQMRTVIPLNTPRSDRSSPYSLIP